MAGQHGEAGLRGRPPLQMSATGRVPDAAAVWPHRQTVSSRGFRAEADAVKARMVERTEPPPIMKTNSKPPSASRQQLFNLEGASSAPARTYSLAPADPCCSPNSTASDCSILASRLR